MNVQKKNNYTLKQKQNVMSTQTRATKALIYKKN